MDAGSDRLHPGRSIVITRYAVVSIGTTGDHVEPVAPEPGMSNKGGAAGSPSMTTCNPWTVVSLRVRVGLDSFMPTASSRARRTVLYECHVVPIRLAWDA